MWMEKADINNDGIVDIYDVIMFANNYGKRWIEFQTIEKGYFSGLTSSDYHVIDNQESWTNLWNQHQSNRAPQYAPPEVNFSDSIVIAVFMGEMTTGGYAIEIRSIKLVNASLSVEVEKTYPGPHCYVAEVITHPYHFIKMDRTDRQLVFETTYTVKDCI
jgi:hypothetical protein